jgi:hypothetical protein
MKKLSMPLGITVLLLVAGLTLATPGKKNRRNFEANLSGFQETPATLSVAGSGELEAELNSAGTSLTFELSYENLTGAAGAAHVHLGRPGTTGGVLFFLCGGGGKPPCPAGTSATITGTVTAADIQAIPAQGIAAGEFDEVLRAMRAGATYVNVHTAAFGSGEIRGHISGRGRGDDD